MCRKLCCLIFLLVMALSLTGNSANADLVDGLLIWHDFEDLVDGSGNGHDAVLGGNARIFDGLLWLDGDQDYADIGALAPKQVSSLRLPRSVADDFTGT